MAKHKADDGALAPLIRKILETLVDDSGREGLTRTPERVEKSLRFLTSGYQTDVRKVVNDALYTVKYDEMVIVKDIEFFSLCEHHLLPFSARFMLPICPGIA